MTTDNPTVAALLAAVRADPEDWDARRVLADALEEAGDLVAANGQRWQARERKWPLPNGAEWAWGWIDDPGGAQLHWRVPTDVMVTLMGGWRSTGVLSVQRGFFNADHAEFAIASALWDLGILVRSDHAD